ncbi:uncharacterized protein [Haliotis asinina]|uniref:uncharacterized protein n=1 Tax=Haliotis asinina TaxID=109174 RepID=UPI003531B78D
MMGMFFAVAVLLVSALCPGFATTSTRLKISSISAVEEGGFVKYSVQYESPSQAEAVWSYGDRIYVAATDTFREGQGRSELVVRNPVYGLFVSLNLRGSLTRYHYVIGQINGELAVSDISIRFSPDPISYTPGEPFDISVETEIEDQDLYRTPYLGWYFVGINSSSEDAPIQVVSAYDALGRRIERTFNIDAGVTTVASSRLTLSSEEGLVFVRSMVHSKSYLPTLGLTRVAYLKHRDHVAPFPSNFVGAYTLSDVFEGRKLCGEQSTCSIDCNGVGPDIVNVELRKGRHGPSLDPAVTSSSEYVHWKEFQIFQATPADQGTYFCIATGRNGRTAEKQIYVEIN